MEIKIYEPYIYMNNMKVELELSAYENWIRQFIPSDYLDHVKQVIFVWDNEEQRKWLESLGQQEMESFTQTKEWEIQCGDKFLGINDPDGEMIFLFLDVMWDTVKMLSCYIDIDPLVYMNRLLLETTGHEFRHIGQQNDLVVDFDFQLAEKDAAAFGHDLYKAHPDTVICPMGV